MIQLYVLDMLDLHVNIAADFFLHPPYPTRIIFFLCFGMVHALDSIINLKMFVNMCFTLVLGNG